MVEVKLGEVEYEDRFVLCRQLGDLNKRELHMHNPNFLDAHPRGFFFFFGPNDFLLSSDDNIKLHLPISNSIFAIDWQGEEAKSNKSIEE